jgi:alpha-glucosidase
MQWAPDGGFTRGASAWLPYGDLSCNVEDEANDPSSLLSLYRRLIWFRRSSKALTHGAYAAVDGMPEGVYAYTRAAGDDRLLVVLNFTEGEIAFDLPDGLSPRETIIGTHGEPAAGSRVELRANEGRLFRL